MYMWKRFDAGEIREDMAHIASLGLHFVRFFLIWEDFQPERDTLDLVMRDRLLAVVDAVAAAGLTCMPTLFTGHMSGVNWLPEWTLDRATLSGRFRTINVRGERAFGIGDFYTGELLAAQVWFAEAAADWLREHQAVYAWDLGNEFSNLRPPARAEDAVAWSQRLTDALQNRSGIGVTAGLHGEDLTENRNIRLSSIARPWPFATMHGYPAYTAFARGSHDTDVVPFFHELTQTFARRSVLFSEFGTPPKQAGGPIAGLDEAGGAAYCKEVVDKLWRRGALGAAWWCYADYVDALATLPPFDRAPHELSFGLLRADGSEKPVARVLKHVACEGRDVQPAPPPLSLDETDYYAGLPRTVERAYTAYAAQEKPM